MSELDALLGHEPASGKFAGASLKEAADSYIRYYAAGSGHTARAKRLDLAHFMNFLCRSLGLSKPEKLKMRDWNFSAVQRFIDDSLARGESPATAARRLATLKHMGRTLADKVPGFTNPAKGIKTPKVKVAKPKALSDAEIKQVRGKAKAASESKNSFIRFRNDVLLEFLLDTGLRADEVRTLKLGQLDDKLEWIQNVRTKGRRYRNVYITSAMRPLLKTYLARRTEELKRFFKKLSAAQDKNLPLFISTYGASAEKPESFLMGAKTIWRAVNELSSATKLHPHLLRHSYAVDLLNNSNDIRLVAQALGHSDVRVTMRYTERLDEEVAAALEKSRKKR